MWGHRQRQSERTKRQKKQMIGFGLFMRFANNKKKYRIMPT